MSPTTMDPRPPVSDACSRALTPRGWSLFPAILVVVSLAVLFGPGLVDHARFAANPWHFNDDVRQQIWALLRHADPALFPDDYIADYYSANFPLGYGLLYGVGAKAVDPRGLAKVLPYLELCLVLYGLVAASWTIAGPVAAWGTGVLCLTSDVYLERMGGGLPRSFAFPLVALGILALVRGRAVFLCVLTVLGAAFYYPIAALLGGTAALHLLALPRAWRGEATSWSVRRRLALLAATALAAGIVVLPSILAGRAYGPLIDGVYEVAYPEAWVGGRLDEADLPIRGRLLSSAASFATIPLGELTVLWRPDLRERFHRSAQFRGRVLWIGSGLAGAAFAALLAGVPATRTLVALPAAGFVLYWLALALWPKLYIPGRYLAYSLPLLTSVIVPAAVWCAARRWRAIGALPAAVPIAIGTLAILSTSSGAFVPERAGIGIDVPPELHPLYERIASLPVDATIAGWPGDVVDNIPYVATRKILIGYETHMVFHRLYADEMRRRLGALIDAYFAADVAALRRLRDELGATHLLVDRDHYTGARPLHFVPFDALVEAAQSRNGPPAALAQAQRAAIYDDGRFFLLDLSKLGDG